MESISLPEGEKQEKYSFLSEDFKNYPQKTSKYKFPQLVTRENFTDWFIQSFAISRGDSAVQILWMRYCELKTGFDFYTSLLAFKEAGGIKENGALSAQEIKTFKEYFDRVKIHKEQEVSLKKQFDEALDTILDGIKSSYTVSKTIIKNWEDMAPEEFLAGLRKYTSKQWGDPKQREKFF